MGIELLNAHHVIAWDMDETLIDGPHSAFFRHYVQSNPQKEHYIITFRDRTWASSIPAELEDVGMSYYDFFKGIHHCPEEYWLAHQYTDNMNSSMTDPDLLVKANLYRNFKGAKAKELGCTVLVDDREDLVLESCDLHGIDFINAYDPIFVPHSAKFKPAKPQRRRWR